MNADNNAGGIGSHCEGQQTMPVIDGDPQMGCDHNQVFKLDYRRYYCLKLSNKEVG